MVVRSSNMREFVLKASIAFVVVTLGIVAGITISVKTGLTTRLAGDYSAVAESTNRTSLKAGDSLPLFEVLDRDGQSIRVEQLVSGQRTLLAFVSNGCRPCHWLVEHLGELANQDEFSYGVLLLSLDPEFFAENSPFPAYRIKQDFLDEYDIGMMPTFLVVNENAMIQLVSSGYRREVLQQLLRPDQ